MIAAIIIADSETEGETRCQPVSATTNWACIDVLGQPVLGRIVDGLKNGGIDSVFVFSPPQGSFGIHADARALALDNWRAAGFRFAKCREEAFEAVLIANCGTYAEFDLDDMLAFHHEQGQPVSRALAADGPVDLWLIDPSRFSNSEDLRTDILATDPAYYELLGYVNRLSSAREFRRLVVDSFSSRCRLRPRGVETRPGVWIGESAEVGRGARLVAPAFVGRGVKIGDDCLITRGSNVERSSDIDFATAVEDSSILPNTYLGIGLDLSHSVANGRNLWNLRHDVTLEITDPVVMRPNPGNRARRAWSDIQKDGFRLSAQGVSQ